MGYVTSFIWVMIAAIGLALYVYPSLFVQHQYEGYENPPVVTPLAGPQKNPEVNTLLRSLDQLINTPGLVPEITPSMPSAAQETVYQSNTGRQQPNGAESKSSKPEPLNQPTQPSLALQQGRVFQDINPQQKVKEIITERIVHVPVPRTCPQQKCPVCPDMRNYIRKDSIPCWACKL